MGTRAKLVLSVFVALLVCLGIGYVWGTSGRSAAEAMLDDVRQQLDLAQARGLVLEARVSLYNNNFGDASHHLEDAKEPLRRVGERYRQAGERAPASRIEAALKDVEEAQRLAGKLDPSANARAGAALDAIALATSKS
ncbi:MAG: hypothetical protein A3H96_14210 [Acidobacteria bacterium RIFCSPLOWO2_02_FULL_67_36]|nr:MAG: hypothetical protein A3H96_14210 [Acidobacteria bacterium RIFCSPLOWO2_02_FULL_67_36]OFW18383.1 MAG: hypothetical protein A3G21_07720 [Acidobacteria bacterium RIFCSPLOWO2_12_FULL_66_21]